MRNMTKTNGNQTAAATHFPRPSQAREPKLPLRPRKRHSERNEELDHGAKTQFRLKAKSRDLYTEHVLDFPLASIKSGEHLAEAQRVIDQLLARGTLDDGEEMYMDALSDLVASYEDEHHAVEPASDADMLRHLMHAKGMSQTQLGRETGLSKSTISEVLAGKKRFSRKMIQAL